MQRNYRFVTDRLVVNEWHSFTAEEFMENDLAAVVQRILTEPVTKTLPPPWQGPYPVERAREWIAERDAAGVTLLAIGIEDQQAVGLCILFEPESCGHIRLGYMLAEPAWGKGIGTELIKGLVNWSRQSDIQSITGGVERDNIASGRVLEKCGFIIQPDSSDTDQLMYKITF